MEKFPDPILGSPEGVIGSSVLTLGGASPILYILIIVEYLFREFGGIGFGVRVGFC